MSMNIVPGGNPLKIAIINPKKAYGDDGQYVSCEGSTEEMIRQAANARAEGCEIRWYYKGLETQNGEAIASQIIVTEIPSGHTQPFHTHHTLHEMTLVLAGQIVAIDSDTLTEQSSRDELARTGKLIGIMEMVIEGPGTRHTIANFGDTYAQLVTVQSARIPLEEFPQDWHRDK